MNETNRREKAVLVGLIDGRSRLVMEGSSLAELAELADTAGAEVTARFIQAREKPDGATYVGEGKVEEIHLFLHANDVDLAIFDDELSPVQINNLEKRLGVRVVDRTQLILDIFAQRARSNEGNLQVELAQLTYLLPRLRGKGNILSRLGGGIGTRGPGETKLESDRRRIRARISQLNKEIDRIGKTRHLQKARRAKNPIRVAALVGYTNAGKSTLMRTMTDADVLVEDKLFATLDPTTRRLNLPDGGVVLLSDTVGFIRKLPHQLVAAFRATLEEVTGADVLLHVVDASHPEREEQMAAVREVLKEIGAEDQRQILVYNKMDRLSPGEKEALRQRDPGAVFISALKGEGLDELRRRLAEEVQEERRRVRLLIPYQEGAVLDMLHHEANIITQKFVEDGVSLTVEVDMVIFGRVRKFMVRSRA